MFVHVMRRIAILLRLQETSRWSLYFLHKDDGLRYALHHDAVRILLGHILSPIKSGRRISPDWELHLNFNFEHKSIKLVDAFFANGEISKTLLSLIAVVDKGWMVPRGELVFVDARTRKQLPLGTSEELSLNPTRRLTTTAARTARPLRRGRDTRITLASVLSEVIR